MHISFFWISKTAWQLFSPDTLLVLLSVLGLMMLWIKAYQKACKLITLLVFLILMISVFPIGDWLYYPLESRFPIRKEVPESIDGILMLGGAENLYTSFLWQQVELNQASERYLAFIHLIKKYPDAKHVFTGGSGSLFFQDYKAAHVAKKLFDEQGLDTSKIIFESQSKNTYENALFTHRLIAPKPGEKWILITSAAHMPRSFGIFSNLKWPVIPYPVDHKTHPDKLFRMTWNFSGNLLQLNSALHEWTGLTAYFLTGKIACFFPKPSDG